MRQHPTLAAALACCLLLSGCGSMLDRSYQTSTAHVDKPVTADDPSTIRVENYQELVSAVLYLVSQGREEGVIRLYNYKGDAEQAVNTACLEVAQQDPLGAYAVEYIKQETSRVVAFDQASLSIHYRRTPEQVRSIVNVTGTAAIRDQLRETLSVFAPETVLRVAYFSEDEQTIAGLLRQAYFDSPESALGLPEAEITLYPDSGQERVVEILLTYPASAGELRRKQERLAQRADALAEGLGGAQLRATALRAASTLQSETEYAPDGGSTAYDALLLGAADDQGMALAYTLLCRRCEIVCEVVEGQRGGSPWYWNEVLFPGSEPLYMDCIYGDGLLHTGTELAAEGYLWASAPTASDETTRTS